MGERIEGVEEVGNGEEYSPSQPTRGSGGASWAPPCSGVRGGAPVENVFIVFYACLDASRCSDCGR